MDYKHKLSLLLQNNFPGEEAIKHELLTLLDNEKLTEDVLDKVYGLSKETGLESEFFTELGKVMTINSLSDNDKSVIRWLIKNVGDAYLIVHPGYFAWQSGDYLADEKYAAYWFRLIRLFLTSRQPVYVSADQTTGAVLKYLIRIAGLPLQAPVIIIPTERSQPVPKKRLNAVPRIMNDLRISLPQNGGWDSVIRIMHELNTEDLNIGGEDSRACVTITLNRLKRFHFNALCAAAANNRICESLDGRVKIFEELSFPSTKTFSAEDGLNRILADVVYGPQTLSSGSNPLAENDDYLREQTLLLAGDGGKRIMNDWPGDSPLPRAPPQVKVVSAVLLITASLLLFPPAELKPAVLCSGLSACIFIPVFVFLKKHMKISNPIAANLLVTEIWLSLMFVIAALFLQTRIPLLAAGMFSSIATFWALLSAVVNNAGNKQKNCDRGKSRSPEYSIGDRRRRKDGGKHRFGPDATGNAEVHRGEERGKESILSGSLDFSHAVSLIKQLLPIGGNGISPYFRVKEPTVGEFIIATNCLQFEMGLYGLPKTGVWGVTAGDRYGFHLPDQWYKHCDKVLFHNHPDQILPSTADLLLFRNGGICLINGHIRSSGFLFLFQTPQLYASMNIPFTVRDSRELVLYNAIERLRLLLSIELAGNRTERQIAEVLGREYAGSVGPCRIIPVADIPQRGLALSVDKFIRQYWVNDIREINNGGTIFHSENTEISLQDSYNSEIITGDLRGVPIVPVLASGNNMAVRDFIVIRSGEVIKAVGDVFKNGSVGKDGGQVVNELRTLLPDGYELLKPIGGGSSGAGVALVKDAAGRNVVMKYTVWEGLTSNGKQDLKAQFERYRKLRIGLPSEAASLLPEVYDFGERQGFTYYTLEYFENAEPVIEYYVRNPDIGLPALQFELKRILDILTGYIYSGKSLPVPQDYAQRVHFDKLDYRLGLLERRDTEFYRNSVQGRAWNNGNLAYKDTAYLFKDLLHADAIWINGQPHKNLTLLTSGLKSAQSMSNVLMPVFLPENSLGDLFLRNILRLPDGSLRFIDVQGIYPEGNLYQYRDPAYDIGKIFKSLLSELVMHDLLSVSIETSGNKVFKAEFTLKDKNRTADAIYQAREGLPELVSGHARLGSQMQEKPDWLKSIFLTEAVHFATSASGELIEDQSGEHAIAYYLLANALLSGIIDHDGRSGQGTYDPLGIVSLDGGDIVGKGAPQDDPMMLSYVSGSICKMVEHVQQTVLPELASYENKTATGDLLDSLRRTRRNNGTVMISAAGRAGEIGKLFISKLYMLGFNVYKLEGNTTEFHVKDNDLILVISGTGSTSSIVHHMGQIHKLKGRGEIKQDIFAVTADMQGSAWQQSGGYLKIVHIPGRTKDHTAGDFVVNALPVSSEFELSVLLYLESLLEVLSVYPDEADKDAISVIIDATFSSVKDVKAGLLDNISRQEGETRRLLRILYDTERKGNPVYWFALGKNTYIVRFSARRMQNMGIQSYVPSADDIVSKPVGREYITMFISLSGSRPELMEKLEPTEESLNGGKERMSTRVLITSDKSGGSALGKRVDLVMGISDVWSDRHMPDIVGGSRADSMERAKKRFFELSVIFYFEGLGVALMRMLNKGEEEVRQHHLPKKWEVSLNSALEALGMFSVITIAVTWAGLPAFVQHLAAGVMLIYLLEAVDISGIPYKTGKAVFNTDVYKLITPFKQAEGTAIPEESLSYVRSGRLYVNKAKMSMKPQLVQYFYYTHELVHLCGIESEILAQICQVALIPYAIAAWLVSKLRSPPIAVIFGMGLIGRGHLAYNLQLRNAFRLVFVDKNKELIKYAASVKTYTVQSGVNGVRNIISGFQAYHLDSGSIQLLPEEARNAEVVFVSIGASMSLDLAYALRQIVFFRYERKIKEPLNIIFVENYEIGTPVLRQLKDDICRGESGLFKEYVERYIGFVEAIDSIIIPSGSPFSRNSLDILSEQKEFFIQVDVKDWKGPMNIALLEQVTSFQAYREEKLFLHNQAHAVTAYLGAVKGYSSLPQAIKDEEVRTVVSAAMAEAQEALWRKNKDISGYFSKESLRVIADDLLYRFSTIPDSVERVGREPASRKLRQNDRLIGAALFCLQQGVKPVNIGLGIAAAVVYANNLGDDQQHASLKEVMDVLRETSLDFFIRGIKDECPSGFKTMFEEFCVVSRLVEQADSRSPAKDGGEKDVLSMKRANVPVVRKVIAFDEASDMAKSMGFGYITAGMRVLELGSGNLNDALCLAAHGCNVVATDYNEEIIAYLRNKAEGIDNISVEKLDLQKSIRLPDASFDVVYSRLLFQYFENTLQESILRRLYKVLKPGGLIVLQVKSKNDILNTLTKIELGDGMVFLPDKNYSRNFVDHDEFAVRVGKAGFFVLYSEELVEKSLYTVGKQTCLSTVVAVRSDGGYGPVIVSRDGMHMSEQDMSYLKPAGGELYMYRVVPEDGRGILTFEISSSIGRKGRKVYSLNDLSIRKEPGAESGFGRKIFAFSLEELLYNPRFHAFERIDELSTSGICTEDLGLGETIKRWFSLGFDRIELSHSGMEEEGIGRQVRLKRALPDGDLRRYLNEEVSKVSHQLLPEETFLEAERSLREDGDLRKMSELFILYNKNNENKAASDFDIFAGRIFDQLKIAYQITDRRLKPLMWIFDHVKYSDAGGFLKYHDLAHSGCVAYVFLLVAIKEGYSFENALLSVISGILHDYNAASSGVPEPGRTIELISASRELMRYLSFCNIDLSKLSLLIRATETPLSSAVRDSMRTALNDYRGREAIILSCMFHYLSLIDKLEVYMYPKLSLRETEEKVRSLAVELGTDEESLVENTFNFLKTYGSEVDDVVSLLPESFRLKWDGSLRYFSGAGRDERREGRDGGKNGWIDIGNCQRGIEAYLQENGNPFEDTSKAMDLLGLNGNDNGRRILLSLGCGTAKADYEVASRNRNGISVVSIDRYDPEARGFTYRDFAERWACRQLPAQREPLENMVILRAEASVLMDILPDSSIDYALLLSPNTPILHRVLEHPRLLKMLKQGGEVVIKPFPYLTMSEDDMIIVELGFRPAGAEKWGVNLDDYSDWRSGDAGIYVLRADGGVSTDPAAARYSIRIDSTLPELYLSYVNEWGGVLGFLYLKADAAQEAVGRLDIRKFCAWYPEKGFAWTMLIAALKELIIKPEYASVHKIQTSGICSDNELLADIIKAYIRLGFQDISVDADNPRRLVFTLWLEGSAAEYLADLENGRVFADVPHKDKIGNAIRAFRSSLDVKPLRQLAAVYAGINAVRDGGRRTRWAAERRSSYMRGQKTAPSMARMRYGRSVFRFGKPRALACGASLTNIPGIVRDGGAAAAFAWGVFNSLGDFLGPEQAVLFLFLTGYFIAGNVKHYRDCVRLRRAETACSMDIHSFSLKRFVFDALLNLVFIDYVCMFGGTYFFWGQLSWPLPWIFAVLRIDLMFLSVSYLVLFSSEMVRYLLARAAGIKDFVFIVKGRQMAVLYQQEDIPDPRTAARIQIIADISGIAIGVILAVYIAGIIGINELFIGSLLIIMNEMNLQRDYLPGPARNMLESMEAMGIRSKVRFSGLIFMVYVPAFIYFKIISKWLKKTVRKIFGPLAALVIRLKVRISVKVYMPFYIRFKSLSVRMKKTVTDMRLFLRLRGLSKRLNGVSLTAKDGAEYSLCLKDKVTAAGTNFYLRRGSDKTISRDWVFQVKGRKQDEISIAVILGSTNFAGGGGGDLTNKGIGSQIMKRLAEVLPADMKVVLEVNNKETRNHIYLNYRIDGKEVRRDTDDFKVVDGEEAPAGAVSLRQVLSETYWGRVLRKSGFTVENVTCTINGTDEYTGIEALRVAIGYGDAEKILVHPFNIVAVKSGAASGAGHAKGRFNDLDGGLSRDINVDFFGYSRRRSFIYKIDSLRWKLAQAARGLRRSAVLEEKASGADEKTSPLIVYHRGGGKDRGYPENTLFTFEKAIDDGARSIELDVRLCREPPLQGTLYVSHSERTAAELMFFDAGNKKSGKQRIPFLAEVLDLVKGSDVELQIELKGENGDIVPVLISLLDKEKMARNVLLTSFNLELLKQVRFMRKDIRVGWLLPRRQKKINSAIREAKTMRLDAVIAHADRIGRYTIHTRGLEFGAWGVADNLASARLMKMVGVDRFTTDIPRAVSKRSAAFIYLISKAKFKIAALTGFLCAAGIVYAPFISLFYAMYILLLAIPFFAVILTVHGFSWKKEEVVRWISMNIKAAIAIEFVLLVSGISLSSFYLGLFEFAGAILLVMFCLRQILPVYNPPRWLYRLPFGAVPLAVPLLINSLVLGINPALAGEFGFPAVFLAFVLNMAAAQFILVQLIKRDIYPALISNSFAEQPDLGRYYILKWAYSMIQIVMVKLSSLVIISFWLTDGLGLMGVSVPVVFLAAFFVYVFGMLIGGGLVAGILEMVKDSILIIRKFDYGESFFSIAGAVRKTGAYVWELPLRIRRFTRPRFTADFDLGKAVGFFTGRIRSIFQDIGLHPLALLMVITVFMFGYRMLEFFWGAGTGFLGLILFPESLAGAAYQETIDSLFVFSAGTAGIIKYFLNDTRKEPLRRRPPASILFGLLLEISGRSMADTAGLYLALIGFVLILLTPVLHPESVNKGRPGEPLSKSGKGGKADGGNVIVRFLNKWRYCRSPEALFVCVFILTMAVELAVGYFFPGSILISGILHAPLNYLIGYIIVGRPLYTGGLNIINNWKEMRHAERQMNLAMMNKADEGFIYWLERFKVLVSYPALVFSANVSVFIISYFLLSNSLHLAGYFMTVEDGVFFMVSGEFQELLRSLVVSAALFGGAAHGYRDYRKVKYSGWRPPAAVIFSFISWALAILLQGAPGAGLLTLGGLAILMASPMAIEIRYWIKRRQLSRGHFRRNSLPPGGINGPGPGKGDKDGGYKNSQIISFHNLPGEKLIDSAISSRVLALNEAAQLQEIIRSHLESLRRLPSDGWLVYYKKLAWKLLVIKGFCDIANILKDSCMIHAPPKLAEDIYDFEKENSVYIDAVSLKDGDREIILLPGKRLNVEAIIRVAGALAGVPHSANIYLGRLFDSPRTLSRLLRIDKDRHFQLTLKYEQVAVAKPKLLKHWMTFLEIDSFFHVQQIGQRPTFSAVIGGSEALAAEFLSRVIFSGVVWKQSLRKDLLFRIGDDNTSVAVYEGFNCCPTVELSEIAENVLRETNISLRKKHEEQRRKQDDIDHVLNREFFSARFQEFPVGQDWFAFASAQTNKGVFVAAAGMILQSEAQELVAALRAKEKICLDRLGCTLIIFNKKDFTIASEHDDKDASA
ncbi:MAG: methyltransferase domain-containing protein, partial [Candidatus Omnitrophota bacterium]